jgi:uncharacterized metal-binding protein YceD (DUF177 family)
MTQTPTTPEFSRPVRLDQIGAQAHSVTITADEGERTALTRRFRLRGIGRLEADYVLEPVAGGVMARGTVRADVVQACAATGQDVPEKIDSPFVIRFLQDADVEGEEVELSEDDCDIMPIEGGAIDMGEAVAQSLALVLNPYPRAPDADEYLRSMGVKQEDEMGAFGALKGLFGKPDK